jgi:AmmeMemoRadiSam system protein A
MTDARPASGRTVTSSADRELLLGLARSALVARLTGMAPPAAGPAEILSLTCGAFVTLNHRGELRGCIGHVEADEPLERVIPRCAVAAGSTDPRFPAVTFEELSEIDVVISLLGPLESIASADEIQIGRHGLVIEQGRHRGLLLPQVAVEWNWDREAFVAATCRKAGLAPDAWCKGAIVWRFEAEVFGEK